MASEEVEKVEVEVERWRWRLEPRKPIERQNLGSGRQVQRRRSGVGRLEVQGPKRSRHRQHGDEEGADVGKRKHERRDDDSN